MGNKGYENETSFEFLILIFCDFFNNYYLFDFIFSISEFDKSFNVWL